MTPCSSISTSRSRAASRVMIASAVERRRRPPRSSSQWSGSTNGQRARRATRSSRSPTTSYPRSASSLTHDRPSALAQRVGVLGGSDSRGEPGARGEVAVHEHLAHEACGSGGWGATSLSRSLSRRTMRRLGYAERGVRLVGRGELDRVDAEHAGEALPEQRRAAHPGGGTVTRWTRSRGIDSPHRSSTSGTSWTPQNHCATSALRSGSRRFSRKRAVGLGAPVLDVLLPLGGDLADEVARGEDDVDLGVVAAQRLQRAGHLHARGACRGSRG